MVTKLIMNYKSETFIFSFTNESDCKAGFTGKCILLLNTVFYEVI